MQKLINLETTEADDWQIITNEAELPESLRKCLIPLDDFLSAPEKFEHCGVWLRSDQDPYLLEKHLDKVGVIALNFATFMDGRSFSQARVLREHLEYKGKIRAIGHFIQDQLHYLIRCGVNEFSVAADTDEDSLRQSMQDFSESYQAASDKSAPLFRRRA